MRVKFNMQAYFNPTKRNLKKKIGGTLNRVKEGFHPKMKTSDKLQFGLHNQPFVFFSLITVPKFPAAFPGLNVNKKLF